MKSFGLFAISVATAAAAVIGQSTGTTKLSAFQRRQEDIDFQTIVEECREEVEDDLDIPALAACIEDRLVAPPQVETRMQTEADFQAIVDRCRAEFSNKDVVGLNNCVADALGLDRRSHSVTKNRRQTENPIEILVEICQEEFPEDAAEFDACVVEGLNALEIPEALHRRQDDQEESLAEALVQCREQVEDDLDIAALALCLYETLIKESLEGIIEACQQEFPEDAEQFDLCVIGA